MTHPPTSPRRGPERHPCAVLMTDPATPTPVPEPRAGDLDEKGLDDLRRVFPSAVAKIEAAAFERGREAAQAQPQAEPTLREAEAYYEGRMDEWRRIRGNEDAQPQPGAGLDAPCVRASTFGPFIDTGQRGAVVLLVNRGGGREPVGHVMLPHQVYVEKVAALLAEDGVRSVEVAEVNPERIVDVTALAARSAAAPEDGAPSHGHSVYGEWYPCDDVHPMPAAAPEDE